MTHAEKRAQWYKEGGIAFGTGVLYGATNAVVGHPMDTVKAKMQAQSGFMKGEDAGMVGVIRRVWRAEGPVGFFRGVFPPLFGSSVYRSAQFAVFEAASTRAAELGLDEAKIPGTGGLAWSTVCSGVAGASARAVVESPIEYAKVKRQTGQTWRFAEAYQGFYMQLPRTVGMMTFIFCSVDSLRRWTGGEALKRPAYQFITWGGVSMLGFWFIWPLETLKNQVQAGTAVDGSAAPSLRQRVAALGGPLGLYRGILPGSISVFMRNGTAAVVMSFAQKKITELGLRG
uniref:Mitochondrial carrier protein n=1 Tax=Zooxanthella nutricula TaxID=1333877 RepID=A0A6V0GCZ8_9DINO